MPTSRTLVRRWRLVGAVLLVAGTAAAQDDGTAGNVGLEWQAPPDCPGRDAVLQHTAEILGGTQKSRRAIHATGIVRAVDAGYQLALTLDGASDQRERTLGAQSCAELVRAAALVLAIAIDPEAALGRAETLPSVGTLPSVPVVPEEPVAEAVPAPSGDVPRVLLGGEAAAPVRDRPKGWVGVGAGVTTGVLDGPATTFLAWQGVSIGPAWVLVREAWLPARQIPLPIGPGGGTLSLGSLGARGCAGSRGQPVTLGGCLGGDLGQLRGAGYGVDEPDQAHRGWAALTGGLLFSFRPSQHVGMAVGSELLWSVARPRFLLDEQLLHRPSPVGSVTHLGLDLHFP